MALPTPDATGLVAPAAGGEGAQGSGSLFPGVLRCRGHCGTPSPTRTGSLAPACPDKPVPAPTRLRLEPPLRRHCPLTMQVRAPRGPTRSGLALSVAGVCRGWCVLGPAPCSRALSPSHQFLNSWPGTHSLLRASQLTCPLPREASPAPHPIPQRNSSGPQVWLWTRGGAQGLDGRRGL